MHRINIPFENRIKKWELHEWEVNPQGRGDIARTALVCTCMIVHPCAAQSKRLMTKAGWRLLTTFPRAHGWLAKLPSRSVMSGPLNLRPWSSSHDWQQCAHHACFSGQQKVRIWQELDNTIRSKFWSSLYVYIFFYCLFYFIFFSSHSFPHHVTEPQRGAEETNECRAWFLVWQSQNWGWHT